MELATATTEDLQYNLKTQISFVRIFLQLPYNPVLFVTMLDSNLNLNVSIKNGQVEFFLLRIAIEI
jgi:hypothetical protein